MKRFFGANGEGFHFNEDEDDDDDELYDEDDMDIEMVHGVNGSNLLNQITTRQIRIKTLEKATEIAKQDWLWYFRSHATRIKRIEKLYLKLIKMLDKKD